MDELLSNHSSDKVYLLAESMHLKPELNSGDLEAFLSAILAGNGGDSQGYSGRMMLSSFSKGVLREDSSVTRSFFESRLREYFPYINLAIKNTLIYPILYKNIDMVIPRLIGLRENGIMTREIATVLTLGNSKMQEKREMNMLYTTGESGASFNRLSHALIGYPSPTVILIYHTYEVKGEKKSGIFGGYSGVEWEDKLGYSGNADSYIFQLTPQMSFMFSSGGKGGTSYNYLNSRKIQNSAYKSGLGFGGSSYENYRLWIDEDIFVGSYVQPFDSTYKNGSLIDESIQKLNVLPTKSLKIENK